jgi:hypothetical protein
MSRRNNRRESQGAGGRGRSRVPPSPAADAPTIAITITLALLLAARAAVPFLPGMWGWSLNLHRFVHPALGWGLWLAAALALVPPLSARAAPWLAAWGDAFERRPTLSTLSASLAGGALAWALPDRVRFVGDFLLRQGTVEVAERPSVLFPQALPLDVFLHYSLPRYLSASAWVDANGASRALGVVEAAVLAALAVAIARALSARGSAAVAVAATVFFGGYVGMFTGFSKAFAELCLLVVAVALFGLRAMREGRGLLGLGIAVAVGLTLHRSALGLLPAAVFASGWWFRAHGRAGAWRRPGNLAGLAIPAVALAVMVPRIVAVIVRWDSIHFTPRSVQAHGGMLAAAFAGTRTADFANLIMMLSPLAPLVPVLAVVLGRRALEGRAAGEAALLALLALPFLAVMPFIHPVQGLFRDWDDFTATSVTVSLLVAWYVAQATRSAGRTAWIAVAITFSAAAPAVEWLAHNSDTDRGLARVRALMLEPPAREEAERGSTWDYLGIRNFRLQRWDAAAEGFSHAAETSPSPRILQEWALSETMRGRYAFSQQVYRRMLEKSPENALGWVGLATVSLRAGDLPEAARAANELLRLQPGSRKALRILDQVALRRTAAPGAETP